MTEPREFSCFDDAGNGWGDTKWDLEEKEVDRNNIRYIRRKIKPQPQKQGKNQLSYEKQHDPHKDIKKSK
jgi:hypothetical protein